MKARTSRSNGVLNVCLCTDLWLGQNSGAVDRISSFAKSVSKNGVNIYLTDRKSEKSLHTLLFDEDSYYTVRNGIFLKQLFPLYILFLFPGLIKIVQESLNKLFCVITRASESEVTIFRTIDPYLFVKLFFICKKEKIDIIQCEFPLTTVFTALMIKKVLKIPVVYDAHNVESARMRGSAKVWGLYACITRKMEIIIGKSSNSIFVVSENDKESFLAYGVLPEKIEVIPNSVDLEKFSPTSRGTTIRDKYHLNNDIVIIFHGALGYPPNRDAINIIEKDIFPQIKVRYPSTHLLLVGSNPPKSLNSNFIVTGHVENLPEYIAAADLAIVPLLRGGGTRIKILEYMACGKAIVSTMKGAEGLNLENGVDIFMTEYPGSQFVELIVKLIVNKSLRQTIGTNARKKAELFYDWSNTAKKVVSVYNNLVF